MKQQKYSLRDLKRVKAMMDAKRALVRQEAAAQTAARRRINAERDFFARAVGPVQPLRAPDRVMHVPPPPEPTPLQRQRDEQAVLQESLSDEFDVSTMLQVDGHLSYLRPGIGPDVPTRLRQGQWAVQAQIDLHGLRRDEAREALVAFLRKARRSGLRCVRVIHGKGLGSPGGVPVLKGKVHSWLVQRSDVLVFVQARPIDGGAGALLVLLASS